MAGGSGLSIPPPQSVILVAGSIAQKRQRAGFARRSSGMGATPHKIGLKPVEVAEVLE
jgi:hypothetical protein